MPFGGRNQDDSGSDSRRQPLAYLHGMPPLPDIGISTSAYAEVFLAAALARVAEVASAAEICSFGLHTLLSKRNRAAAQAAGLPYTVHGPFGYNGLGDPSETVRLDSASSGSNACAVTSTTPCG